jgi:hypothetical protein
MALEVGRAAYGLGGLLAPTRLARWELGLDPDPATVRVTRVLGVRHLAQATLVTWAGTPTAHVAGAVVDAVHAVSMVAVAFAARRDRRYYVASAVLATSLAALEWRSAARAASERGAAGGPCDTGSDHGDAAGLTPAAAG